jgi:two-component system KDP operon response regulator KdpE
MAQRNWLQGRPSPSSSSRPEGTDNRPLVRSDKNILARNAGNQTQTPATSNSSHTFDVRRPLPTLAESDMDWGDKTVLIVEDEKQMVDLLTIIFSREGATTYIATDGESGLRALAKLRPDLLLLDMRLPVLNGFEVLKAARLISDLPVVIVTAISQHDILIGGFLAGADDYVKKPFRPDELLVRSWAAVRREQMNGQQSIAYEDGYLTFDLSARLVEVHGERVKLTSTEFDLFAYLMGRNGKVCTFQQILDHVWNDDSRESADLVHVFIWQIRQKIEPNPKRPVYLISEHSIGYRFESQRQSVK